MRNALFRTFGLALLVSCGDSDTELARRRAESDRLLGQLVAGRAAGGEHKTLQAEPPERTGQVDSVVVYRGEAGASRVRAVIQLSGEVPFRRRERPLPEGDTRAVLLDFEHAGLGREVPKLVQVHQAGLERVVTEVGPEGVSLVLELARGARYQLYALGEPRRLVLDIELPRARASDGGRLVVLDPGHGGEDYGSPGPFGLWEGHLTLDISRRVRSWLARLAPDVRVRLTRDSDVYITLEERAAMANALGAHLFVSVHLNAANATVERGGVATFVLDVSNDRNVLRLAARENGTRTTEVSPLSFLVGSLARSEQRAASDVLASLIQRGTVASARRVLPTLADRGVKSAMFYVLVGAQMPAVLVEASFITQPDEAERLRTSAYRDVLAEGIARGIAKYLAQH